VADGWNPGDQPPAEWENWKNKRDEEKTNELVDLANDLIAVEATPLVSGLNNRVKNSSTEMGGGLTSMLFNKIESLVTSEIDNFIKIYDPKTLQLVFTKELITDVEDTANAVVLNLAGNGNTLYVMFCFNGGTYDGDVVIQAYQFNEDFDELNIHPDWPHFGITIASGVASYIADSEMVVSPAGDYVISLHSWNEKTTSATANLISIVDATDGTLFAMGDGDCPYTNTTTPHRGLAIMDVVISGVSDAIILFQATGGTEGYLCTALLSDPTSGYGGPGWPYTYPDVTPMVAGVCVMEDFILSLPGGDPDEALAVHTLAVPGYGSMDWTDVTVGAASGPFKPFRIVPWGIYAVCYCYDVGNDLNPRIFFVNASGFAERFNTPVGRLIAFEVNGYTQDSGSDGLDLGDLVRIGRDFFFISSTESADAKPFSVNRVPRKVL
jgi:hypothetical protein